MKVHCIVPGPGQERPGERLDFFLDCSCRMQTWQTLLAKLDIPTTVRPITVMRACPEYCSTLEEGGWRTLTAYPACIQCQQWTALWFGLFIPEMTPYDIRPLANARGIELDVPWQSCGNCSIVLGEYLGDRHD